ncbi:uncharacterized protein LOC143245300 isoform X5 [Tachypleus tridentatus]|uniref:uncharacterized protein LOC143245300 isoform X5 n=1 Tax=Tachypleus tridentatus TaxID=6853 RepID=UPI003FD14893
MERDWGTDSILRYGKFTGHLKYLVHRGNAKAVATTVIHSVRQPQDISRNQLWPFGERLAVGFKPPTFGLPN